MSLVARGRTVSTVTPSLGDRFVNSFGKLIYAVTASSPRYGFAHLSKWLGLDSSGCYGMNGGYCDPE
jgi:hypothetical protein